MAVRAWRAAGLALLVAGCATTPVPGPDQEPATQSQSEAPQAPEPAPMIESPPIEPVEPPLLAVPAPSTAPEPTPPNVTISPPAPVPAPTPQPSTIPPPPAAATPSPPAAPPEPVEDAQVVALIADLSRYSAMGNEDVRREIAAVNTAFARQRNDANRVRLAVLYTLARAPQDDQRALQLLDNVTKSGGPVTPVKNLALVLQAQLVERQRSLREEQQKSEQAVRKLDQLLEMERALLRDRVRSGGGGGGGGGGGSAGH
jgi:hypothetical protein